MTDSAFGHPLDALYEGATRVTQGVAHPLPLTGAAIDVRFMGGLALVRVTRRLTNAEAVPIEAILTFPVGFEAIVTGLSAEVDGRLLQARAQAKAAARDSYEGAIDRGKLAVLHEEVLRGVHMLSVANLAPGQEVRVTLDQVVPVAMVEGGGLLRLPQTVGQLYGASPLQPADDLVTGADALRSARLTVEAACPVVLQAQTLPPGQTFTVSLAAAIELVLPAPTLAPVRGMAADGREVEVAFAPVTGEDALDLAILFDRSGSTDAWLGEGRGSVWSAMRDGLERCLARARPEDRFVLWQFESGSEVLGAASGPEAAGLAAKIKAPGGGTELGRAIEKAVAFGARDILVMTDGQTWAGEVDRVGGLDCRISAVLVGRASLDAMIGHMVALRGGQLFYAPGAEVEPALQAALKAARSRRGATALRLAGKRPARLTCRRGGLELSVTWGDAPSGAGADAVGRFAAGLALPGLSPGEATALAVEHGLCGHHTSLVLVDEAGAAQGLLPEQRKVALDVHLAGAVMEGAAPRLGGDRFMETRHMLRESAGGLFSRAFGVKPVWDEVADLAARIDWDGQANAFLQGDLSALTLAERQLLRRQFYRAPLVEHAARLGIAIDLLALALVAVEAMAHDIAAARFARRLLGPDAEETQRRLTQQIRQR